MSELEETLWNVPIKSTQVIKKYIRDNFISKDKIKELIKEIQETMCPMCCECGLCEEFEKVLEENNNE